MITSAKIQRLYNKMYTALRPYIWDIQIVESIADLEIATYQLFPNKEAIEKAFKKLKSLVVSSSAYKEDTDLIKSFDKFEELLNEIDTFYLDITTFKEVVSNEDDNQEEPSEELPDEQSDEQYDEFTEDESSEEDSDSIEEV